MASYTFTSNNSLTNDFSGLYFEELKMEERIPIILQNDFWIDLIDALKKEIALYIDNIRDITEIYTIDKMEADRLIEISNLLKIPLDSNVDSSLEFLREEVRTIPFKISYKATSILYLSFFTSIKKLGTLFLYYFTGDYLVRDSKSLLQNIVGHNTSLSLFQESTLNFSGNIITEITLDNGHSLDIDDWHLDTLNTKLHTNHFAIEYFCNDIIIKDSINYLMTDDYFNFLYKNILWGKKGSEVPHIGCQVSCITDSSNDYNTLSDTNLTCATTTNYNPADLISSFYAIEFGTGSITPPTLPSNLDNKIAKILISDNEKYEENGWQGVVANYDGQFINDIIVASPDGGTASFNYTLPNYPIRKGNVKIKGFISEVEYTLTENKDGILSCSIATGTIDYTTGDIYINTDFLYSDSDTVGTGDGNITSFNYTVAVEKRTNTESTYIFTYKVNNITYIATDNGAGVITGTYINSGSSSIIYGTGAVTLVFTLAPTDDTIITINWQWQKTNYFDADSTLIAEYYTETEILITEACIRNLNDDLICYATFNPIQFLSSNYHININFFIKQTNF